MHPARVRSSVVLAAIALAAPAAACARACGEAPPPPSIRSSAGAAASASASAAASAAPDAGRPEPAVADGREVEGSALGEAFKARLFGFDLGAVELAIADVDMKSDLAPIVAADPAIRFAVNGGFFGQKTEPVGLVEVGKKRLSGFSRPMSGGVLSIDDGKGTLTSTESYNSDEHHAFAIQCKPRLVVGGAVNIRSDDGKRAERTAMCLRREGKEIVFATIVNAQGGPSLFATAHYLRTAGCDDALNLDGGPSTGIAWREAGAVQSAPPRGGVRHAVLVRDRPKP